MTKNISLAEKMKAWGEKQSEGWHYANSNNYVRDLIRRCQEHGVALAEQDIADT